MEITAKVLRISSAAFLLNFGNPPIMVNERYGTQMNMRLGYENREDEEDEEEEKD